VSRLPTLVEKKKLADQPMIHEVDDVARVAPTHNDAGETTVKAGRVFPQMEDSAAA
jgi:hypothetical protein